MFRLRFHVSISIRKTQERKFMKKVLLVLTALLIAMIAALAPVASRPAALAATAAATEDAEDRTGWPETFIIGVSPGENVEKALAAVEPLRLYMEASLKVRTVVITGTSYNAVIEAMRAGRADAFEVGPLSYLLAAQVANAEAIAVGNYTTTVDTTKVPGYYSVLLTKKGSGITKIADLKGKSISFADPASTSGYLIPATEVMNDQKLDSKDQLETFFSENIFAGGHPASVLAIAGGKVDAAATFDDNLNVAVKNGTKICGVGATREENPFLKEVSHEEIAKIAAGCADGDVVVFHQSTLIPQTPFAINSKLPQSFKDAVKKALLDLKDDQATVDALGRYYVDPTTIDPDLGTIDGLYDGLRITAKKFNLDLTKR
jgi:phosphonate transport system substrate-binding protein